MEHNTISLLKKAVWLLIAIAVGAVLLLTFLQATMGFVVVLASLLPLLIIAVVLEKAAKQFRETPIGKGLQHKAANRNLSQKLPPALMEAIPVELQVDLARVCWHIHAVERQRNNSAGKTEYVVVFKNGHRVAFREPAQSFVAECVLCYDLPPT